MKKNYYWCKTCRNVWIVKYYTEEEAKRCMKIRYYRDMKIIG